MIAVHRISDVRQKFSSTWINSNNRDRCHDSVKFASCSRGIFGTYVTLITLTLVLSAFRCYLMLKLPVALPPGIKLHVLGVSVTQVHPRGGHRSNILLSRVDRDLRRIITTNLLSCVHSRLRSRRDLREVFDNILRVAGSIHPIGDRAEDAGFNAAIPGCNQLFRLLFWPRRKKNRAQFGGRAFNARQHTF